MVDTIRKILSTQPKKKYKHVVCCQAYVESEDQMLFLCLLSFYLCSPLSPQNSFVQRAMLEKKAFYLVSTECYLPHLLNSLWINVEEVKREPWLNFQEKLPKVCCRTAPVREQLPPSCLGSSPQK